jgi:hypothetical protein
MTSAPDVAPDTPNGRILLFSGHGLAYVGVVAYMLQISSQRLMVPWYMPIMALLGAALVALSLWKKRTTWRALGFVVVVLLAGTEIAFLFAMRLPPYVGPISVGRPFPAFEAKRADGGPFIQNDLIGDRHEVLVFFRGRW